MWSPHVNVDTLGLPTIYFTYSAADLQWPELANLICPEQPDTPSSRIEAEQLSDSSAIKYRGLWKCFTLVH